MVNYKSSWAMNKKNLKINYSRINKSKHTDIVESHEFFLCESAPELEILYSEAILVKSDLI